MVYELLGKCVYIYVFKQDKDNTSMNCDFVGHEIIL